jgi:HEPN domain-containing protein
MIAAMPLPPKDPDHWLFRLTPEEWLQAARHELSLAEHALHERAQRKGVANARRGAGMALNAVLIVEPNEGWGRSYMDHLRAVATDISADDSLRAAAKQLVEAPLEGPRLIHIGGGADDAAWKAAEAVLSWVDHRVRKLLAVSCVE